MFCKRKFTTATLRQLRSISSPTHQKNINFIAFLLCCMPFAFSISVISASDKEHKDKFTIKSILMAIKMFFYCLQYPIFPNMVALLYCVLCQRCYSFIGSLTQEVRNMSPMVFGPSQQIYILRRKAKVDGVLNNIQNVFSVPIFFMLIANLSSCAIVVAWILEYSLKEYQSFMIIGTVFFVINSFSSMTAVLWMAGQVPIQLQKLKESFYEKAHLRLISVCDLNEPQYKKELLEKPDFVLTGCDIISLRRSTILGVFGTLLTYTVLAVSIKGNGVNERNATCTV
ncbi:uncharacterized protein CDAR_273631 [Caerostris darwini]|uniref:Gustatory receptor n=1 Tax=Caerostris darwini TaxID=1538125 RepID=A0AAV4SEI7_9ARAC|nr:uncharacterized protein CDAR_273631 [Caerostris darwini]